MSHDRWAEHVDAFALGALDGEDLDDFERHLAEGCLDCQRAILETQEAVHGLVRLLPPVAPPTDLKQRLFDQIETLPAPSRQHRPLQDRRAWFRIAVAASLFLLASLTALLAWDDWSIRQDRNNLASEILSLQALLAKHKKIVWYLDDPAVETIPLQAVAKDLNATARVLWRPSDRRGYLLAHALPEPGPNRRYALWAIGQSGPIPAGLYVPDDLGRLVADLPKFPAPETGPVLKFAITLEPSGGSIKPTGPILLVGSAVPQRPA